jgi:hypothetical protein
MGGVRSFVPAAVVSVWATQARGKQVATIASGIPVTTPASPGKFPVIIRERKKERDLSEGFFISLVIST